MHRTVPCDKNCHNCSKGTRRMVRAKTLWTARCDPGGTQKEVAITRFAELKRVFRGGQSELLNGIARLAILYEDLRVEIGEFRSLHRRVIELGDSGMDHRVSYFLRRSLATLVEFRGALTVVRKTDEF